jgi:putative ABC transport system substrate-binding protein
MERRKFALVTLAAVAMPRAAFAQTTKRARIGYLSVATLDLDRTWLAAFHEQLRALGYSEGVNLVVEQRHALGHADKLLALAAELLGLKPDVLVVYGAWHIVDKLRGPTPVVFTVVPDPVAQGIVSSLARPGANITGFSDAHDELVPKRLQLIKEIAPAVSCVAVLHFQSALARLQLETARAAAPSQGLSVVPVAISGPQAEEIQRAFGSIVSARAEAVLVIAEPTTAANRHKIADACIKHRLIAVSTVREFAEAGFLLSYGANFHELWRRAAIYADKILKGARPGDLPVERPTKFDLVINLSTAKALGISVPRALLLRADHIIE